MSLLKSAAVPLAAGGFVAAVATAFTLAQSSGTQSSGALAVPAHARVLPVRQSIPVRPVPAGVALPAPVPHAVAIPFITGGKTSRQAHQYRHLVMPRSRHNMPISLLVIWRGQLAGPR